MMMTQEDQDQYDNWTKKQIYTAYLGEHAARKQSEVSFNKMVRQDAALRYDRDMFRDKWLRLHIEKHVAIEGEAQTTLDKYFNDVTRRVYFTNSGGYYCTVDKEDCIIIAFAWANTKRAKDEYKNMPALLKSIANTTMQPIRWTGVNNVLKNHSVDLGRNRYELKL